MTDLHFRLRDRSQRLWVTEQDLSDNKLFREAADRTEQLEKNCEALSQLVESVREDRYYWMSEFLKWCLSK